MGGTTQRAGVETEHKRESKPSPSIPSSLLPDWTYNATSCLRLLLPCLSAMMNQIVCWSRPFLKSFLSYMWQITYQEKITNVFLKITSKKYTKTYKTASKSRAYSWRWWTFIQWGESNFMLSPETGMTVASHSVTSFGVGPFGVTTELRSKQKNPNRLHYHSWVMRWPTNKVVSFQEGGSSTASF